MQTQEYRVQKSYAPPNNSPFCHFMVLIITTTWDPYAITRIVNHKRQRTRARTHTHTHTQLILRWSICPCRFIKQLHSWLHETRSTSHTVLPSQSNLQFQTAPLTLGIQCRTFFNYQRTIKNILHVPALRNKHRFWFFVHVLLKLCILWWKSWTSP